MNIDEITESIKSKLGDEESGKIADDLASLLIHDKSLNDSIKTKDAEIEKLKNDKDLLVSANANLLLKIRQFAQPIHVDFVLIAWLMIKHRLPDNH